MAHSKGSRIVVLGGLLLAACSAAGPLYQAAPAPPDGSVLVYLFRPSRFAMGGQAAHFFVDGVEVASLSNGGYTWLHASPGSHLLKQTWLGTRPIEVRTRWEAGQTYFYRLETSAEPFFIEWRLARVPEPQALPEISRCRFQPAADGGNLHKQ